MKICSNIKKYILCSKFRLHFERNIFKFLKKIFIYFLKKIYSNDLKMNNNCSKEILHFSLKEDKNNKNLGGEKDGENDSSRKFCLI